MAICVGHTSYAVIVVVVVVVAGVEVVVLMESALMVATAWCCGWLCGGGLGE